MVHRTHIGRITTSGDITEYSIPTFSAAPQGIANGPDGALWFTEDNVGKIGRITTSGDITEYSIPTSRSQPLDIVTGPDGALWFTEQNGGNVGRITMSGIITEYPAASPQAYLFDITTGPDGALWFTTLLGNQIGRITTTGSITNFLSPTSSSQPLGITTGPDGALWFTENNVGKIAQLVPNDNTPTPTMVPTYTLSGNVYNDNNQNGLQDTGENAYQGAIVTLSSGQTVIGTTTTDANGNYTFSNLQPGTYTDTLTVPNGYSAITTNPASIEVSADTTQNFGIYSKPHVGAVTVNPNPVQINTAVTATATFTDADTTDTHTAQIDWDVQGSSIPVQNCQVTEPNGSTPGSVSCSLPNGYSSANIYSVAITVYDNDGASDASKNPFVSVYTPTPSGRFAAGQGYVSPLGTFAQSPAINTGIVQLALSYKYSGTIPAEQKQFMMTFGNNITYSATSITSLVISNGIGTLTGTGTFSNSSTIYKFLVTGEDSNNTIRIQITDPNNNNAVIYDTQQGNSNTALPITPVTGPQGQAGHGDVIAN